MSRFIQCGCGRLVNVDSIARVEAGYKKHDDCTIITKDGEYLTAPSYAYDEAEGKNHIVQLIPANGKYQVHCRDVFGKNGGKTWVYDVEYFAVCANGEVRPMECVDGYFDFSDTMGNYMGFKLKALCACLRAASRLSENTGSSAQSSRQNRAASPQKPNYAALYGLPWNS